MQIPVRKERLYRDVEHICSIQPARNYQNIDSLNQTADYILGEFQKLDGSTAIQSYSAEGQIYKNVIATFYPEKEKRIVIGAHYDVDGDQPGADDNASAVAGLLETARLLNELKPDLKHRVEMVAFTLEEAPFFYTDQMGSAIHAQSLRKANVEIELMICLEMIGYFSEEPNSQSFPIEALKAIYPNTANFITLVGRNEEKVWVQKFKEQMLTHGQVDVQSICAPIEMMQDITRSDHYNYWKRGYPALMITDTSFLRNPNYHQKTDTIDTLNFDYMVEVVRGLVGALIKLF